MRPQIIKLFLLLVMVFGFKQLSAQAPVTCEGGLGDPVVNIDFGSGTGAQHQLDNGVTNFIYWGTNCANIPDGDYSISNMAPKCYGGWVNLTHDHTYYSNGDSNGNMMIINASQNPSIFFTQPISNQLCDNTTYEFSAYVINLDIDGPGVGKPDIEFSIETPAGTVLATYDTQPIIPTNTPEGWVKYSMYFKTPPGGADIVLKMTNKAPGGNGNDLAIDDIQFRACGPLIQAGFVTVTDNAPKGACAGVAQVYDLTGQLNNNNVYTNPREQWQQNTPGTNGWVDIPGETGNNLHVVIPANSPIGDYLYRLGAADGANINSLNCRVYSDVLTVSVNPYPVATVTAPPGALCEGQTLSLTGVGGVSYVWSGPGVTAANKTDNPLVIKNVTTAAAGSYTVTAISGENCPATSAPINVVINPVPVVSVNTINPICLGGMVQLQATAPGTNIYSWSPATGLDNANISNPVANPTQTTTYTVTATSASGCAGTNTITVTVNLPPAADAGPDKKVFEGTSVKLDGKVTNADTYYWTPTTGLDNPQSLTPLASPTDDITYTLHAISNYNCGTSESSVFVKVYKKVTIPNTFSPNGDGTNDTWEIVGLNTYDESTLKVFNRYGQQVFSSTGYSKPWNGSYNGKRLPSGTYYYTVDLKNGAPLLSGWVLIVY